MNINNLVTIKQISQKNKVFLKNYKSNNFIKLPQIQAWNNLGKTSSQL